MLQRLLSWRGLPKNLGLRSLRSSPDVPSVRRRVFRPGRQCAFATGGLPHDQAFAATVAALGPLGRRLVPYEAVYGFFLKAAHS